VDEPTSAYTTLATKPISGTTAEAESSALELAKNGLMTESQSNNLLRSGSHH
jgi:hypothetical protein